MFGGAFSCNSCSPGCCVCIVLSGRKGVYKMKKVFIHTAEPETDETVSEGDGDEADDTAKQDENGKDDIPRSII